MTLMPDQAHIQGSDLTVEGNGEPNLGNWNNPNDYAHWKIRIKTPGTFEVTIN